MQDLYIHGVTGNIGNELVELIYEQDADLNIIALSSKEKYISDNRGLRPFDIVKFARDGVGNSYSSDKVLNSMKKRSVVINVSSGENDFDLEVIENTNHKLFTANKFVVTGPYDKFRRLTKDPERINYDCTVMGGNHAIGLMNKDVESIEACLSGSIQYLISSLYDEFIFTQAYESLLTKDYVESDPRKDLRGTDVAGKLLTLVRSTGKECEMSDIDYEQFVPEEYMEDLPRLNSYFNKKISGLKTLAYIASYKDNKMRVGLELIENNHPLASIKGVNNKIIVNGSIIKEAAGAGARMTAQNILNAATRICSLTKVRDKPRY